MVYVFPEPWTRKHRVELSNATMPYCLTIGKNGHVVSIEDILQNGFNAWAIKLFLQHRFTSLETTLSFAHLLRFRSKDEIVFECSSFAEHNLIGLRMNGDTALLFMILFSLYKRSHLDESRCRRSSSILFTHPNSNFHAVFWFVGQHFHVI